MKKISVLIPCFNEEENVAEISKSVEREITQSVINVKTDEKGKSKYEWEIVFIDNNSTDNTRTLLREICAGNKKIKAIFNAKNFGQFNSP